MLQKAPVELRLTHSSAPFSSAPRVPGRTDWLDPGRRGPPRKGAGEGGPLPLRGRAGPRSSSSVPRDLRSQEGDPGSVGRAAGAPGGGLQRGQALQVSGRWRWTRKGRLRRAEPWSRLLLSCKSSGTRNAPYCGFSCECLVCSYLLTAPSGKARHAPERQRALGLRVPCSLRRGRVFHIPRGRC